MSDLFRLSIRQTERDSWRPIHYAGLAAVLLFCVWVGWFCFATIPVFSTSESARIEADGTVHAIEAPSDGQVLHVRASLGQLVAAGDVLIDLDTRREALRREDELRRAVSRRAVVEQLRNRIAIEQQSLLETQQGSQAASAEADARFREADELAKSAEHDARRGDEMYRSGLSSAADRDRLRADASRRRAAAASLDQAVGRLRAERTIELSARRAALEKTQADLATAEADLRSAQTSAQVLAREEETRLIRAPVAGRIAEIIALHPGSVVQLGDRLTSIVPQGALIVVAQYHPAALGRLAPKQLARVRLDGFSSIEYGTVTARLRRIAIEPKDSTVRVELEIVSVPRAIRLQHGFPAVVEIETERITPATLLLRVLGKRLEGLGATSEATSGATTG